MQDKRSAPRREIERTAHIEIASGPPIPCTLSDVSQSGGRLALQDTASLPEEFILALRDDLRRWCRIMRRSDREVGVKFIAAPEKQISQGA